MLEAPQIKKSWEKSNHSILENWIVYNTMLKQDQENLASKIKDDTQSKITAELLDSEMSIALLNSVNPSFTSQIEGIVTVFWAKN